MVITTPIEVTAALDKGLTAPKAAHVHLVRGDAQAHEVRVHCTCGGTPADLTGLDCTGTVRRSDGVCITVPGQVAGDVASFVLTGPCYEARGLCRISLTLSHGGVSATHTVCTAYVSSARTEETTPDHLMKRAEEAAF